MAAARLESDRTIASYNILITLDRDLALKYTKQGNRADFKRLLEDRAKGIQNTAVINNRDESFLSLDHKVAWGGTGKEDNDKQLSIKIEVFEPELQFLRALMDTALSKRLAKMVEERNKLVAGAAPNSLDVCGSPEGVAEQLYASVPRLFPKVYIMYGTGSDLGHWAGPFEAVLINANYDNSMTGLEKTLYTFVASPENNIAVVGELDTEKLEKTKYTIRVPLFQYNLVKSKSGAKRYGSPTGGTIPRQNWWKIDPDSNRILDVDTILTELISHYLSYAAGIQNHLVILPDLNDLLATYLKNQVDGNKNMLDTLREEEEETIGPLDALYDPGPHRQDEILGLEAANAIYSQLGGLKVGSFDRDKSELNPEPFSGPTGSLIPQSQVEFEDNQLSHPRKTTIAIDAPIINQEEFLDLESYTPFDSEFYVYLDITEQMDQEIRSGNYLKPIVTILESIANTTTKKIVEPFFYWESNLELSEAYRNIIGTTQNHILGTPVSDDAGMFIFGDKQYIKDWLQAGILISDEVENLRVQKQLQTGGYDLIPAPLERSNAKTITAWSQYKPNPKLSFPGYTNFWTRVARLNDSGSSEFRDHKEILQPYVNDGKGLPLLHYLASIIGGKYETTSFFDPDLAINKVPDEFALSNNAKERIKAFGLPIFRCNTSNPNVLKLNIQTDDGFFPLLATSFSELEQTLAYQTAAIYSDKIKVSNMTVTTDDVAAMMVKLLTQYSNSDAMWKKAEALLNTHSPGVNNLAKNLTTILTTQTGLGKQKVHKKYSRSASMSFLYFFFKLFNFRFAGQIKALPMFEYSDGAVLSRPCLLYVNRLNQVRQLYDGHTNKNTTNSFYSGLYRIFGFRHFMSTKDAYSEFLVVKDPLSTEPQTISYGEYEQTTEDWPVKTAEQFYADHPEAANDPRVPGTAGCAPWTGALQGITSDGDEVPEGVDPWSLSEKDPATISPSPDPSPPAIPKKTLSKSILDWSTEFLNGIDFGYWFNKPPGMGAPIKPLETPPANKPPQNLATPLVPLILFYSDWVRDNTAFGSIIPDSRFGTQTLEDHEDLTNLMADYMRYDWDQRGYHSEEEAMIAYWESLGIYKYPDPITPWSVIDPDN